MALGLVIATICLGVVIAILAVDIMGIFSSKNHFEVDGRTVVITGGSQGMGRGLARLLASKGANVVIVARNQQKLDDALKYIAAAAKNPQIQRFHAISADVARYEENARMFAEVARWNDDSPPDVVWANAGVAHPSLFIDTPLDIQRSQMDINYWSTAYLAHLTLRAWLQRNDAKLNAVSAKAVRPRHFVMTSSVACLVGIAGYAPYAPPKAALRSLADQLHSELNLYNGYRRANPSAGPLADVKIHCVVPGTITSPGYEREKEIKHPVTTVLEDGDPKQSEDEVARGAVRGLEKGGFIVATNMLGNAMRVSMMGGSPRNNLILDTLFSWVTSIAWLFIGPDMEGKVFDYGKKNKIDLPQ